MNSAENILEVQGISKQYRLGLIGTGTLSHDLKRWWYKIRGKEDPFLKIGETNDRSSKAGSDYVWALRDITFEVKEGEVLGIIGKNGAGKSTLLKILSKVTSPSTGTVRSRGRIASLLEVGTGFHPELTGRENIFLNGAILGMTKKEIASKLEEIIEFSGCQRYIDTPVKRYSSGMTVRLAFAVAAFLEPEILIVDEVLAVGDAEFQKKALGKMQEISKGQGRTVIFVSHNMGAVKSLCTRGILLENGKIALVDEIDVVIESYLGNSGLSLREWHPDNAPQASFLRLLKASVVNQEGKLNSNFNINSHIHLDFTYEIIAENERFTHGFNLFNGHGIHILSSHDKESPTLKKALPKGIYTKRITIPGSFLAEGYYSCSFAIMRYSPFVVELHELDIVYFNVIDEVNNEEIRGAYTGKFPGVVRPILQWT